MTTDASSVTGYAKTKTKSRSPVTGHGTRLIVLLLGLASGAVELVALQRARLAVRIREARVR